MLKDTNSETLQTIVKDIHFQTFQAIAWLFFIGLLCGLGLLGCTYSLQ